MSASSRSWLISIGLLLIHAGLLEGYAEANEETGIVVFPAAHVYVGQEARAAIAAQNNTDSWHVEFADIPEAVLRESYAARDDSIACTPAAAAILELEDLTADDRPTDNTRFEIVSSYVEQCLTTLGEVSNPDGGYGGLEPEDSKTLIRMIGLNEVQRLQRSLLVSDEAFGAPCSGSLVWVELEARRTLVLATAAHCVGRLRLIEERPHISVASFLDFLDFEGRRYQINLVNGRRSVALDPLRDDFALIVLGTGFDEHTIGMPVSLSNDVEPWTPIYVIGQNRYLKEQIVLAQRNVGRTADIQIADTITIGFDPFCRAFGRSNAVLFHNCQTVAGTSGAAVFVLRGGVFELIGVHSGYRAIFDHAGVDIQNLLSVLSESRAQNYATLF